MPYASPEFALRSRSRVWPTIVFSLVVLAGLWFTVVLYVEQSATGDDPATWAILHTRVWGWIALAVFLAASLYFLLLLVRREVPAKVYVLRAGAHEGEGASFPEAGQGGEATTAEADRV